MKFLIYTAIISLLFLTVSCGDPGLENVAQPKISTGETYSFPSTMLGESTTSEFIEIKNIGQAPFKITSALFPNNGNEYDISSLTGQLPKTLEPNDNLIFTIKFTPSKIRASHNTQLHLKIENEEDLVLKITAPENKPVIKLDPSTLVYSTAYKSKFRISNVGNAPLTIKDKLTIENSMNCQEGECPFYFDRSFTNIAPGTKLCPRDAAEDNPLCNGLDRELDVSVNYQGTLGANITGRVVIPNDGTLGEISYVNLTASGNTCHLIVTNVQDDTLDFGTVFINEEGITKIIALINVGKKECQLDSIELTSEESGIFSLEYLENYPQITSPITIPIKDEGGNNENQYLFRIRFKPAQETSYRAKLTIKSNEPTWQDGIKEITVLGQGTKATKPLAVCDPDYFEVEPAVDNPSNPISVITLDGSQSSDPSGGTLTFKWEKISGPNGSVALPRTPTQATTKYFVDAAGEHKLKLTVTNQAGLSDSCEVTAMGVTSNALHVELFWDKNGDVDLHLKKPGTGDSSWGSMTDDCFWKSCKQGLEWGQPGDSDNPKLDRDDMTSKGPENINIDAPKITNPGEAYMVGVKNYNNSNRPTATVRIYCNGGAQFEYSMSLPEKMNVTTGKGGSFWWVAGIEWTEHGCNINPINSVGSYPGADFTR